MTTIRFDNALDPLKRNLEDQIEKNGDLNPRDAKAKGLCFKCKQPALPKCYSDAGRKEYKISGLCEQCFDAMFKDDCTEPIG
jgi:hypothetical protein